MDWKWLAGGAVAGALLGPLTVVLLAFVLWWILNPVELLLDWAEAGWSFLFVLGNGVVPAIALGATIGAAWGAIAEKQTSAVGWVFLVGGTLSLAAAMVSAWKMAAGGPEERFTSELLRFLLAPWVGATAPLALGVLIAGIRLIPSSHGS
jgi:hypothetical protein